MKLNKKQFLKWIEALDSGMYKQGKFALQTNVGYCCLGVACEIFIPRNKRYERYNGLMGGGTPDSQDNSPEWLKKINEDFEETTSKPLTNLNDYKNFSFPEIATMLEFVYIHKAFD